MARRLSEIPYIDQEPRHMLRFDDFVQDVDKESLPCTICNAVFAMNGLLDLHYEKVHGYPPTLSCYECKAYFKRKRVLMGHFRTSANHVSYNVKYLGCDICDAFNIINAFRTQEELEHHSERVHGLGTKINEMEQARYVCPIQSCNSIAGFAYRKGMIEHVQIMHSDHFAGLLGMEGDDSIKLREELHHRCPHCSRVYRVKESLDLHVIMKHTNSPERAKSMKRSLESSISGEMLDFEPPTKSRRMNEPFLSPKEANKYACQFCTSRFSRESVLSIHIDVAHKGARSSSETLETSEDGIFTEPSTHDGIENGNGRVRRIVKRPRISESPSKTPRTISTSKQPSAAQSSDPSEYDESEEESDEEHFPLPPNFKLSKPLSEIFNESYMADNDPRKEESVAFFGKEFDEKDLDVDCCFEGCERKFPTTNSMNRHVAFFHRAVFTANLMKLGSIN